MSFCKNVHMGGQTVKAAKKEDQDAEGNGDLKNDYSEWNSFSKRKW